MPKNFPSRPTTDFAKEGLFNILDNMIYPVDLKILDLCAGTGNIAFEFLSREMGTVTAVDIDSYCLRFVQKNANEFGISNNLETIKSDIISYISNTENKFDLIFADPPYDYKFHKEIAEIVFDRNLLKEDGLLIIEHGKKTDLSEITHFLFCRTYGNVNFSFFQIEEKE